MWQLSPAERLDLQRHAPALEAEDILRLRGPQMTADELYDWVLLATGSETAASDAFNARRRAELKSGRDVPGSE